jgi:CRISPR/Cas system CMR-associated protein Cmr3 (group 5 of RAMP superfamily)
MKFKIQLVISEDDQERIVTDIVTLNKKFERVEHLGLTLNESKEIVKEIQKNLLEQQTSRFLDGVTHCRQCGTKL